MYLSIPRCANGYYGSPIIPGQKCSACECNGNVDPSEPGYCDPVTGECLKCVRHTAGRHCERCEDGYHGDAIIEKNCQGMCIKENIFRKSLFKKKKKFEMTFE